MSKLNLSDVLDLPVPDRIRLVQAVWDSIAEVPEAVPLTEAERQLLDGRLEAYYRNPGEGAPWAEVKARLLEHK